MGSKGSQTTKMKLPKEFQEAYTESLGLAREAIDRPYTPYTGQLVAGLSPLQQQGMNAISGAQGMARPYIEEGADYTRMAAQGITPELYQRFYSPYVRDVADATFANLMESAAQQRSGLKSGAIQAGAFGGDRGGVAQAEMARQQQLANAQSMSNIYNQGYGQAMTLAGQQVANMGAMGQQLAGLGTGLQGAELQAAQAMLAGGAQQQATEQARLQAAYDQWMQQQSYPYQQAQFFANISQGLGSTAGGSTTTPGPNAASQIIGGIGAVGSLAGGIGSMSDERVKENIEAVGTLNDGQTIYRYNFKGDPKTQIGLLAQEVEHRKPGAVSEVRGLKMVNYKDATEDAANSMGGVVTPGMDRQGLAGGGVPFFPYMTANTFIPEGKMGSGSGMGFPKPYEAPSLSEGWKDIKPLTEEQTEGLGKIVDKAKLAFSSPEPSGAGMMGDMPDAANAPTFESGASSTFSTMPDNPYAFKLASGGVAGGRRHYANGGYEYGLMPEDDPGLMNRAIEEAAAVPVQEAPVEGLAGVTKLLDRESGGNFNARNAQGYVGRGQFGEARLEDARRAGVLPAGMDAEAFRKNPDVQKAVENWHFSDINNFIDKNGLASAEGQTVGGIPVTRQGLINVAHLGGKDGLAKFISSGGRYNPPDANGTRLSDYLAMGSGVSGGVNIVPASDTDMSGVAPAPSNGAGLAGAEVSGTGVEKPKSGFDLKKLFASEDNPSLIESIIGRRLSPEARAAVLNASFALMAGRSPFFGVNLGEAGQVGTQTYYNALAQKRATEKMRADLSRQGFEAQTQRMGTAGQLAGIVGPVYKALTMWQGDPANAGKPLPDWIKYQLDYLKQIGIDPSTLGSVAMSSASGAPAGTVPPVQSAAAMPGSGAPSPAPIPPPSSTDLPAADGTEAVSPGGQPVPPAAPAATPAAVQNNPEAANFFDQTLGENNYTNPFYHLRMAGTLRSQGLYEEANKSLAEGNRLLTEIAKNKTITTPQGDVVNVPSALTASAEAARSTASAEAYQKSVNQIFEEDYRAPLRTYGQTYQALSKAANVLRGFETGSLTELKSNIAGVMDALGIPVSQEQLDAASDNQQFTKLIIGNLLNSGLKQNLGNVALGELQIAMRGTASSENQPSANRSILGVSLGVLNWQRDRAMAIGKYIQENGGSAKVDPIDLQDFVSSWDEKISEYTEEALANTPVKGELNFSDPDLFEKAKVGWKYVMPDGEIATFNGTDFVGED